MTADDERWRELAEAFSRIGREFGESMASLTRALQVWWGSPDSQAMRTIIDYYQRHPEELDKLVGARAQTYREDSCHCLCQWKHHGGCSGEAATWRMYGGVQVPLCPSCAAQSDLRRTWLAGSGAEPPADVIGGAPRDEGKPR